MSKVRADGAGDQVDDPVGEAQAGDRRLGPVEDVHVDLGRLLLGGIGQQLDLVELVDPQQAPGVAAGRAGLAAEARRVGHEFER